MISEPVFILSLVWYLFPNRFGKQWTASSGNVQTVGNFQSMGGSYAWPVKRHEVKNLIGIYPRYAWKALGYSNGGFISIFWLMGRACFQEAAGALSHGSPACPPSALFLLLVWPARMAAWNAAAQVRFVYLIIKSFSAADNVYFRSFSNGYAIPKRKVFYLLRLLLRF